MTTESYLAQLGATMETAKDFIMGNVSEPRIIYDICKFFSVNNDMIAEVLQSVFPGLTGQSVSDFFNANGFNGSELGFNSTPTEENIDDNNTNIYDIETILSKTFYTMDQEEGTFDINGPINAFTASAFNESLQNDKTFNLVNNSWVLDTSEVDQLSLISNVTVNSDSSYTVTSGYGAVEFTINDDYWTMQADTEYGVFYQDMCLAPNDYMLGYSGAETFIA